MNPLPLRSNSITNTWSNAREQELNSLKQEASRQARALQNANKISKATINNGVQANNLEQPNTADYQTEEFLPKELKRDEMPKESATPKTSTEDINTDDANAKLAEIESRLAKLEAERQAIIAQLSSRDLEVRQHEQAHIRVGQELTGAPSYETITGPDGKSYIVNGEVPIDVSVDKDPEITMHKMQKVMRAALAPPDPSPADQQIYSIAQANYNQARVLKKQLDDKINQENLEKAKLIAKKRIQANDEYVAKTNKLSKMAFEESIPNLLDDQKDKKVSFPFAKKRNQVVAVLQKLELFGRKNVSAQETVENFFNWSSTLKLPASYNAGANLDVAA